MAEPGAPGYELPILLFAGFRGLIDELHRRLAQQGHPQLRPAHGFAMQAIGAEGASATEVARRLGVSKQAAGKTIDRLEALGYAVRDEDSTDGRRKVVRLTDRGRQSLALSAAIFEQLRAEWAAVLGGERLRQLESDLRRVVGSESLGLDAASWFGP